MNRRKEEGHCKDGILLIEVGSHYSVLSVNELIWLLDLE